MTTERGVRILELDGLRGIAIMLVMIYHMTVMKPSGPFDELFVGLLNLGWSGVDLFFVLSGFLITGILLNTKHQPHYFRNFWLRRALRIFPLYYAVVFFSLVVLPEIAHPKMANFSRIEGNEIWYWLYLSNFSIAHAHAFRHGILDVSWSLAIEEQFYLIWPFVVLRFENATLQRICLAMLAGTLLLRLLLVCLNVHEITIMVLTPTRLDGLATGALIALLWQKQKDLKQVLPTVRIVLPMSVLVIVLLYATGALYEGLGQATAYMFFSLLYGCVLILALTGHSNSRFSRVLNWRILRIFGKYSYAMYLFHLPLRALVRDTFYGPADFAMVFGSPWMGQVLFYSISMLLTLLMAMISWVVLEQPLLRLKRFFPYGRRVAAVTS